MEIHAFWALSYYKSHQKKDRLIAECQTTVCISLLWMLGCSTQILSSSWPPHSPVTGFPGAAGSHLYTLLGIVLAH